MSDWTLKLSDDTLFFARESVAAAVEFDRSLDPADAERLSGAFQYATKSEEHWCARLDPGMLLAFWNILSSRRVVGKCMERINKFGTGPSFQWRAIRYNIWCNHSSTRLRDAASAKGSVVDLISSLTAEGRVIDLREIERAE